MKNAKLSDFMVNPGLISKLSKKESHRMLRELITLTIPKLIEKNMELQQRDGITLRSKNNEFN